MRRNGVPWAIRSPNMCSLTSAWASTWMMPSGPYLRCSARMYRQHDGVIATHGERACSHSRCNAVVGLFDDLDAGHQIEGIDRDVADIGHLQAVEGRRTGRHVVGTYERRLGADRARTETRAAAIGGADVEGHAHEAGIQTLGRIGLGRQAHHRRRAAEARHLVAAQRLVEIGRVFSWRHSGFSACVVLRESRRSRCRWA